MKKIAYLLSAALFAGTLASCDLDSMSMTSKDTSNFPVNAEDAAQALAGIYQNLNAVNANPQETWHYYAMLASDDQYGGGGTNDKLMQAMDLILNYNVDMTPIPCSKHSRKWISTPWRKHRPGERPSS